MFRKLIIAVAATAALGAAALAPTAASAAGGWHGHKHHWHGHKHHGWHRGHGWGGFYGPAYLASADCYVVKRVVMTPYGKRVRPVTVCD